LNKEEVEIVVSFRTQRRAIREGLLTEPLDDLPSVRLIGSSCTGCGEVTLGNSAFCPNCGADDLTEVVLSSEGELLTYSVIRHQPPGNYKGPVPFRPYGIGLVALEQGVSVVSPLEIDIDDLAVGLCMRFEAFPLYADEQDIEVIAFRFTEAQQGRG